MLDIETSTIILRRLRSPQAKDMDSKVRDIKRESRMNKKEKVLASTMYLLLFCVNPFQSICLSYKDITGP